jgi:flagellar biosynthesis protein FliP
MSPSRAAAALLGAALAFAAGAALAQGAPGGFGIELADPAGGETSSALRILVALTVISLIPSALVAMTAFTRIIIVLTMLRQGLGMPETPPNMVLIGLALFLTLFTMTPVVNKVSEQALTPYLDGKLPLREAASRAAGPLRDFMVRQTREQDLVLMVELSKAEAPQTVDEISLVQLVPAFMLSELRTAFQIGFVIFLPFLLIDLVISAVLMSMGMLMVPPIVISLPIKVLIFVLVDGWTLVVRSLMGSFA